MSKREEKDLVAIIETSQGVLEATITVRDNRKYRSGMSSSEYREWQRATGRRARCYIDVQNESILENFANRFSRPVEFYRKEIMPMVIAALCSELDRQELTFSWSQKAGCGCGCSPGFILTGINGFEIWVSLNKGPVVEDDPKARYIADRRGGELVRQFKAEQEAADAAAWDASAKLYARQ